MKDIQRPRNLAEMFVEQGEFSGAVRKFKGSTESASDKILWAKEYTLAGIIEFGEMVDHLKWKPHRAEHHFMTFDRDGFIEEGVDVFNYLVAQLEMYGVSGEEFEQVWRDKYQVLEQRRKQEVLNPLKPGDPVVMIDLDGCVADFRKGLHEHFWAQNNHIFGEGRRYENLPIQDPCTNLHCDLDWGIDPLTYRQVKWDFEAEGGYRHLPLMPRAKELIEIALEHAPRIIFVTSRTVPLKRIYRDTLVWINTHFPGLNFDLFVDEKKAERLALSKAEVKLCVEDDPKHIDRLLAAGHPVMVPIHLYNQEYLEKLRVNKIHYAEGLVTLLPAGKVPRIEGLV